MHAMSMALTIFCLTLAIPSKVFDQQHLAI